MPIIIGDKKLTTEKIIQVARSNKKVALHPDAIDKITIQVKKQHEKLLDY